MEIELVMTFGDGENEITERRRYPGSAAQSANGQARYAISHFARGIFTHDSRMPLVSWEVWECRKLDTGTAEELLVETKIG